jgi:hypothetical protein
MGSAAAVDVAACARTDVKVGTALKPHATASFGNGFGNKTPRNCPKSVRRAATGGTREAY